MYQNDKFEQDEWEYLQMSIPIIFHAIADADNKIDKREKNAMQIILDNAGAFDSELMNELLESIKKTPDELLDEYSKKELTYKDGLKHINRLLDYKLDRKEAMDFKKTLIAIGTYIGDSSGKFLHRKLSQVEEDALHKAGKYLDVPVKELFMTKILDRLLSKVNES